MPIEFVVLLEDNASEEEQKEIATELSLLPCVIGVYRYAQPKIGEPRIRATHTAPGAMQ